MTEIRVVAAAALRPGDLIFDGEAMREVTSVRLQGAPIEAVVEMRGQQVRTHYLATAEVQVATRAA